MIHPAPGPMNCHNPCLLLSFLLHHHPFIEEMLLFNLPVLSLSPCHAFNVSCSLKSHSPWSSSEPHVSFFHPVLLLSFLPTLAFVASCLFPAGFQNPLLPLGDFPSSSLDVFSCTLQRLLPCFLYLCGIEWRLWKTWCLPYYALWRVIFMISYSHICMLRY